MDGKIKQGVFFGPQIRYFNTGRKIEEQVNKWEKQHGNHSKNHYQFSGRS